jgi:hypothetical protein
MQRTITTIAASRSAAPATSNMIEIIGILLVVKAQKRA